MSTFVPFVVGLTASTVFSFSILEKISDRRNIELRRDLNDNFIASTIYKQKLAQLIRLEERTKETESPSTTKMRGIVDRYVVNPLIQDVLFVSDIPNKITETVRDALYPKKE